MQRWFLHCGLMGTLSISAFYASAAEPDVARDTVTPTYDWKSFPYTWEEILAGKLPITPVHWNTYAKNPVVKVGMNARPIRWNERTIRVYYGVRGPGQGIYCEESSRALVQFFGRLNVTSSQNVGRRLGPNSFLSLGANF